MMNRLQLRERVLVYLRNRSGYEDTINEMLNETCDSLAMPFYFPRLEGWMNIIFATGNNEALFTGTVDVVLSAYHIGLEEYRNPIVDIVLEEDELIGLDADVLGLPTKLWYDGVNRWVVYPTPDAPYTIRVKGKKLPTPMVDDADSPVLPRDWHPIIAKMTAAELLFALGEDERAMAIKNEALAQIATRQEYRTLQRRGKEGQISVQRKMSYRRGRRGYGQIEE